jgi:hypothetical protein
MGNQWMNRMKAYSVPITAACQSAANLVRFDGKPVLRGFGNMHGKLHGLPKKVL